MDYYIENGVCGGPRGNRLCHEKLLLIVHMAFSEIRKLIQIGEHQRAYDLADAVEFIPELMLHWQPAHGETIRDALRCYAAKYSGSGFDYLALLEMSEADFAGCYLSPQSATASASALHDVGA